MGRLYKAAAGAACTFLVGYLALPLFGGHTTILGLFFASFGGQLLLISGFRQLNAINADYNNSLISVLAASATIGIASAAIFGTLKL